MKVTVEMQQYVCDGCGKEYNVNEDVDGPPLGYHGTVTYHGDDYGGGVRDWYADKPKCIRGAILTAVTATYDPTWGTQ